MFITIKYFSVKILIKITKINGDMGLLYQIIVLFDCINKKWIQKVFFNKKKGWLNFNHSMFVLLHK